MSSKSGDYDESGNRKKRNQRATITPGPERCLYLTISEIWSLVTLCVGILGLALGLACEETLQKSFWPASEKAICSPVSGIIRHDVSQFSFALLSVSIGAIVPVLYVLTIRFYVKCGRNRKSRTLHNYSELVRISGPAQTYGTVDTPTADQNQNPTGNEQISKSTLYAQQWLSSWGDRMWQFAVPLILMDVFVDTLLPGALFTMVIYIASVLLAPSIGQRIDNSERIISVIYAIVIENVCLIGSCVMLVVVANVPEVRDSKDEVPELTFRLAVTFGIVIILGLVAQPMNNLQTIAIQRDWIVVMAENEKKDTKDQNSDTQSVSDKLTGMNTTLRRIDLLCKILAPVAFGLAMQQVGGSRFGKVVCGAVVVGAWNLLAFPLEMLFIHDVYCMHPELASKTHRHEDGTVHAHPQFSHKHQHHKCKLGMSGRECHHTKNAHLSLPRSQFTGYNLESESNNSCGSSFKNYCVSMAFFFSHSVFLASFAYSMLYMTVLDMGDLMTSYLKWRNVPESIIGLSRGIGACSGMLGTFIYPCLMSIFQRLKGNDQLKALKSTGTITIWVFALTLTPCAFVFLSDGEGHFSDYVLLGCTALARVGLWSFDLAETQILQISVSDMDRGKINSMQAATYQLLFVGIQIGGMIFHNPRQFSWLVAFSVCVVIAAAVLFTIWSIRDGESTVSSCQDEPTSDEMKESK